MDGRKLVSRNSERENAAGVVGGLGQEGVAAERRREGGRKREREREVVAAGVTSGMSRSFPRERASQLLHRSQIPREQRRDRNFQEFVTGWRRDCRQGRNC